MIIYEGSMKGVAGAWYRHSADDPPLLFFVLALFVCSEHEHPNQKSNGCSVLEFPFVCK